MELLTGSFKKKRLTPSNPKCLIHKNIYSINSFSSRLTADELQEAVFIEYRYVQLVGLLFDIFVIGCFDQ